MRVGRKSGGRAGRAGVPVRCLRVRVRAVRVMVVCVAVGCARAMFDIARRGLGVMVRVAVGRLWGVEVASRGLRALELLFSADRVS